MHGAPTFEHAYNTGYHFAGGTDFASQVGRTIDLFNWTSVTPTGTFTISSPYTWNLSKLYTTGEVTLTAVPQLVPGDYNGNGIVGPEDYDIWKSNFGSTTNLAADGNGNHVIDAADYTIWRDHLGKSIGAGGGAAGYPLGASAALDPAPGTQLPRCRVPAPAIPEPSSLALLLVALPLVVWRGNRRRVEQCSRHTPCAVRPPAQNGTFVARFRYGTPTRHPAKPAAGCPVPTTCPRASRLRERRLRRSASASSAVIPPRGRGQK